MNILTIGVIVLGFMLAMLVIALILMMISTTKELTKAIQGISLDRVEVGDEPLDKAKFVELPSSGFGRAPAPKKDMKKNKNNVFIGPKNHKDWGIH